MSKTSVKRGRVETIKLKKPIVFNSDVVTTAVIEIDHINFGLNKKTGMLNTKARTRFTIGDVENFLMLLDGEQIIADSHKGRSSRFVFRIDCPIKDKFYGKEFIMIFDTHYDKSEEIYTVTIFPGW